MYGVSENNSVTTLKKLLRREGNTGSILISLIEQRLDNVI